MDIFEAIKVFHTPRPIQQNPYTSPEEKRYYEAEWQRRVEAEKVCHHYQTYLSFTAREEHAVALAALDLFDRGVDRQFQSIPYHILTILAVPRASKPCSLSDNLIHQWILTPRRLFLALFMPFSAHHVERPLHHISKRRLTIQYPLVHLLERRLKRLVGVSQLLNKEGIQGPKKLKQIKSQGACDGTPGYLSHLPGWSISSQIKSHWPDGPPGRSAIFAEGNQVVGKGAGGQFIGHTSFP